MKGSVLTGNHGYLVGREYPIFGKRDSIPEVQDFGELTFNLSKMSIDEQSFSTLCSKQALFPKIFLPVSIESTGAPKEYRIRASRGALTLKSLFDNLAQHPRTFSELDVKALFCTYLYTYAEIENIMMFDFHPSFDRIYVHEGKLRMTNPLSSPSFIDNFCKVMVAQLDCPSST